MELYTSLTRLKQEVAGQLPPMTPVSVSALELIDPAFTIGMGALEEDPEKGLRCPVRGCGKYFHSLKGHLQRVHADVGGADAVLKALDIHSSCKLITARMRAKHSASNSAHLVEARAKIAPANRRPGRVPKTATNTGYRNLRDHCEAQVREKLVALEKQLGRSPSSRDVIAVYGEGLVSAMKRVYGTWDNAKAQLGFAPARYGPHTPHIGPDAVKRDAVLRGIRAFYEENGRFPTAWEADCPKRTPLICMSTTTKKALRAKTWPEAMHTAAMELDIVAVRPDGATPALAAYAAEKAKRMECVA